MKIKTNNLLATGTKDVLIPATDKRLSIIYFYPKDSTPGCTTEGQDFRDQYQYFLDNDIIVYGVSKDSLKSHEKFKAKQNFPFELIADIDGELCEQMGVWRMKKFMGREYMGIVRSTFLLSGSGEVLKEWEVKRVKGHVSNVIQYLEEMEK